MLEYEESRTESIAKRLVAVARMMRSQIVGGWMLSLGVIGAAGGYLIAPSVEYSWILGGMVGGGIGLQIGSNIAGIATVYVEWMAQMLVAEENILNELRTRSQP